MMARFCGTFGAAARLPATWLPEGTIDWLVPQHGPDDVGVAPVAWATRWGVAVPLRNWASPLTATWARSAACPWRRVPDEFLNTTVPIMAVMVMAMSRTSRVTTSSVMVKPASGSTAEAPGADRAVAVIGAPP